MKRLYAPWRSSYIKTDSKECPFCAAVASDNDSSSFVLARSKHSLIMLNKYPYNAGHILVVPHMHEANLSGLTPEVRAALMEDATRSTEVLKKVLKCEGVNVGLNFGKASGGSIPDHLHLHVLPRWQGDTSFLATLSETKLISFDLSEVYEQLKMVFLV